jgi:hypothetical protein
MNDTTVATDLIGKRVSVYWWDCGHYSRCEGKVRAVSSGKEGGIHVCVGGNIYNTNVDPDLMRLRENEWDTVTERHKGRTGQFLRMFNIYECTIVVEDT